jgi:methionyl aminopeptidase
MIIYKTLDEIEIMRQSALMVSKTLGILAIEIKPGVTPLKLDKLAEEFIRDNGAIPGFKGLYGCPSTLLTSVNEQVVHGLPTNKPLEDGDIISVDCGVLMNEYYGDHAYTFAVGNISEDKQRLLDVTLECLMIGIESTKAGNRIGDIGYAIQQHAEINGYGVVRELVGHGLGKSMHEEPEVPNYGRKGHGKVIKDGLVIAIEPMINMGTYKVLKTSDNWTIVTADGKPSAHFEHNVAVINGVAEVLSTFTYIEEALRM